MAQTILLYSGESQCQTTILSNITQAYYSFLAGVKTFNIFTSYLRKYRLTPASVANVLTGGESEAVIV